MIFYRRLKEIMDAKGVSKSQLARDLGITPQAVGQWGKAGGTMPVGDKLARIASILDVSMPELMSDVGAPFRSGRSAHPVQPQKHARLVDQPDQIALLDLWEDLAETDRIRVFNVLKASVGRE